MFPTDLTVQDPNGNPSAASVEAPREGEAPDIEVRPRARRRRFTADYPA